MTWHHVRGRDARRLLLLGGWPFMVAGCYEGLAGTSQGDDTTVTDGGQSGDGETTGDGVPAESCSVMPRRVWKLTPPQLSATVAAMIPGMTDAGDALAATLPISGGYSNEADVLAMSVPHTVELHRFAIAMAEAVLADPGAVSSCLATDIADVACVRAFALEFAEKGYRRTPSNDEVEALVALYTAEEVPEEGLEQLVAGVFMSPRFLYRTELGEVRDDGLYELTDDERASALAYLLLDGPPDEPLRAAAESGELRTPAGVAAQAERLLGSAETSPGLLRFLGEHLGSEDIAEIVKDPMFAPEFDLELATSMEREALEFFHHVLWADDARWATILTSPTSVIDPLLAAIYGVEPPDSGGFAVVDLPVDERAGIMTQPGMMARIARTSTTDPVGRGKFIREVLLCQDLPPPPEEVDAIPPPPSDELTKREQLQIHSEDPSCAGCHALIDPLGLAFESYDLLGRHRLSENGKILDLGGRLDPGSGAQFANALDLMRLVAEDPRSQKCFVRAALRYGVGRAIDEGDDACVVERLDAAFAASNGDIRDLVIHIVSDENFFVRAAQ